MVADLSVLSSPICWKLIQSPSPLAESRKPSIFFRRRRKVESRFSPSPRSLNTRLLRSLSVLDSCCIIFCLDVFSVGQPNVVLHSHSDVFSVGQPNFVTLSTSLPTPRRLLSVTAFLCQPVDRCFSPSGICISFSIYYFPLCRLSRIPSPLFLVPPRFPSLRVFLLCRLSPCPPLCEFANLYSRVGEIY